ncbi:MAG: GDSL-type esterase/lipase family protein, partial [Rhizomicrobium sp.]
MTGRFKFFLSMGLAVSLLPLLADFSAANARPLKILAMGTSLTQGYGLPPGTEFTTQLQAALKAQGINAEIVNAGVSGDTRSGGLSRLDWSLADHPDAAIIELGSNDMLRGVPPSVTEKNLRAILNT